PDIESKKTALVQSNETDEIMTAAELRLFEANNIRKALQACGGKVYGDTGAAALLGMKPTTLASRIKSLGIASS
ncbi:helix-turn-helix domain-containing protein, partial [Rhodopirellula bahusiensis]